MKSKGFALLAVYLREVAVVDWLVSLVTVLIRSANSSHNPHHPNVNSKKWAANMITLKGKHVLAELFKLDRSVQ